MLYRRLPIAFLLPCLYCSALPRLDCITLLFQSACSFSFPARVLFDWLLVTAAIPLLTGYEGHLPANIFFKLAVPCFPCCRQLCYRLSDYLQTPLRYKECCVTLKKPETLQSHYHYKSWTLEALKASNTHASKYPNPKVPCISLPNPILP